MISHTSVVSLVLTMSIRKKEIFTTWAIIQEVMHYILQGLIEEETLTGVFIKLIKR